MCFVVQLIETLNKKLLEDSNNFAANFFQLEICYHNTKSLEAEEYEDAKQSVALMRAKTRALEPLWTWRMAVLADRHDPAQFVKELSHFVHVANEPCDINSPFYRSSTRIAQVVSISKSISKSSLLNHNHIGSCIDVVR